MTVKNVLNTSTSLLGLPNGQQLAPKATTQVANWDLVQDNIVVKAWLESGAIVLEPSDEEIDELGGDQSGAEVLSPAPVVGSNQDLPDDASKLSAAGQRNPWTTGAGGNTPEDREKLLGKMTNDDLRSYIEQRGGTAEAGAVKADLVAVALKLPE